MFKRWENIPEVVQAFEKLDDRAFKYTKLIASGKSDDRVQAQKIWNDMSSSYWELLFTILEAQTKNNPSSLSFDTQERLFIDLGFIPGIVNINKDFRPDIFLNTKCNGGIFPTMTFSDYIAYYWSMIMGNDAPESVIAPNLEGRISALQENLLASQSERNNNLLEIAKSYPTNLNLNQLSLDLSNLLIPAMKVNMRVPEYREGDEITRQNLAKQRKAYIDAEKAILLFVSAAQKNQENPLPLPQYEKFLALHDNTKIIAKKILYSQIDRIKIARRSKKITDACSGMTPQMKSAQLKDALVKKRDYLTVPAKNARVDTSLLCQPDSMPIDYKKNSAELENIASMDIEMFNVPRVRMYGIPTVIFVPGQGLGTYDWSDHSILIPAFPVGGEDKSLSYALGTFRWDSDEDRKLKTPYEQQIKDNRKKSLLALAQSFCKDYSLWITKEKKGYRILPRETHKVFVGMFSVKQDAD